MASKAPAPALAAVSAPADGSADSVENLPRPSSAYSVTMASPNGGKEKQLSTMGLFLGSSQELPGSATMCKGSTAKGSPAAGSTRKAMKNEISDRIAQKYASLVAESEDTRRAKFVPLHHEVVVPPTDSDVAHVMKSQLDNVLDKTAHLGKEGVGVGWQGLFRNDNFQKKLQFITNHARTGHFIERYGVDGHYEGEFLYGMRHGKGVHEFRGDVYEGEFKWDQRHGWGTLTLSDKSQICGNWEAGKPHSFTTILDKNGTVVYEGEFKAGKRHGLGRQLFDSGDTYDGGWCDGRLHDRGVYYFNNGDKLIGMWKHGVYHGIGVFHYADGSISRRSYEDGVLTSVQDYEHSSQRFGRALHREGMQKHTSHKDFPSDVFLLSGGV